MQLFPEVVSLDEHISNLNVRGGNHDQNLFLWNGARLYLTGYFFGMISTLNPCIAHDIQIYKNGSSSFFTEGLSSVIDISSSGHKYNSTDFEFFINFLESSARADVALSDSSHIRVAGRYALSALIDTPTFQNSLKKYFKIQNNIQNLRYWISYSYNDNNYEFDEFSPSVFPNNFESSHQVHFGFSYVMAYLKFEISAQYFTGRPVTSIDANMPILNQDSDPTINFLSPNTSNLGDYKQVNFTSSYYNSWKKYDYEIGLSILNVFDSSDITNQFYRLDNNAIEITNVESRSLALTPNVFFRLNF